MYLEMIGSLIILAAGVSVVAQRGTISLGNAGLSIAFALQVRELQGEGESHENPVCNVLHDEAAHQAVMHTCSFLHKL